MVLVQIIQKYVDRIKNKRSSNETVEEYTEKILDDYLKDLQTVEITHFSTDQARSECISVVSIMSGVINSCLKNYRCARLDTSVSEMRKIIETYLDLFKYTLGDDIIWYRMRKTTEGGQRTYPANEMFHLPFQLRGKVSTQRYSISGYPCLYLGYTSYACWEEMHQPTLANVCVSSLRAIEPFSVLDLRVPLDINGLEDKTVVEKWIKKLPLVLACSIKVLKDEDVFKPEYIIPQLVMLSIANNPSVIGCYYVSTRRNDNFKWNIECLQNVAMPVKRVGDTGFCPKLAGLFEISDSTCYEYETIKGSLLAFGGGVQYCTEEGPIDPSSYESSIWGQIDKILVDAPKIHVYE